MTATEYDNFIPEYLVELAEVVVEYGVCLGVMPVVSLLFWFGFITTVAIKRFIVFPRLVAYYKDSFVVREEMRRRRLRDTLNDPVLLAGLRANYLCSGKDPERLEDAVDELRAYSNEPVSEEDDTKGEEKMQAIKSLWRMTLLEIISIFLLRNTIEFTSIFEDDLFQFSWLEDRLFQFISVLAFQSSRTLSVSIKEIAMVDEEYCDELKDWQSYFSWLLFCLLHLIHMSIFTKTLPRAKPSRKRKDRSNKATDLTATGEQTSTLKEPLLP